MSLHYNTDTFQPAVTAPSWQDGVPSMSPLRDEQRDASPADRPKHLPNGARVICSDKRSKTVLCVQHERWSVWSLGAEGDPLRGSYFKTMQAAAFDYAAHIMGCHPGGGDGETTDVEE